MTDESKEHLKMVQEYKLGLKIVAAHLSGAGKLLNNIITVTKDAEEKGKAQFVQERLRQCLAQLTK